MAATQTDGTLLDTIEAFFSETYRVEIGELLQAYPDESTSLTVDYMDMFRHRRSEHDLAERFLESPSEQLEYLAEALRTMPHPVDVSLDDVQVRVRAPENGSLTSSIDELRADHTGDFLAVAGQVARVTPKKPKIVAAAFECQRCGTRTQVPQIDAGFQEPHECSGCERQGPFKVDFDQSEFVDHQLIRLQQPPEEVRGGEGETIDVHVEGDLVDTVQPGDRVDMSGILRMEQASSHQEKSPLFDQYLEGIAADVKETDFEDIDVAEHRDEIEAIAAGDHGDPYELLIQSLAPTIKNLPDVKLALMLQLFGGVSFRFPNQANGRGHGHVLLVGDPGTAKSTLLDAVAELAPRSAQASGRGATEAGITAGAVADDFGDQEWSLRAGVLVRAHKGIACIDEIDKVGDEVVSSMHKPMEQQVVTVSKIVNATLPCRTAVLGAGNPKYGRFDPNQSMADQIELESTLLSRFDLIFLLTDVPDEDRDRRMTDSLLQSRELGIRYDRGDEQLSDEDLADIQPAIPPDVLRAYIACAKQECYPTFANEQVKQRCTEEFLTIRLANTDSHNKPVPVTLRKLMAFRRFAEASARVRLSDTIEMEDIERTKELIMRCMNDVGIDPESGELDADIVEAGSSKSQRDRIKNILGIVVELQNEYSDGAPIEEVRKRAGSVGISDSKVDHELDKLRQKGEVYEPADGHVRTTDSLR